MKRFYEAGFNRNDAVLALMLVGAVVAATALVAVHARPFDDSARKALVGGGSAGLVVYLVIYAIDKRPWSQERRVEGATGLMEVLIIIGVGAGVFLSGLGGRTADVALYAFLDVFL